jgi:hypothetical protein
MLVSKQETQAASDDLFDHSETRDKHTPVFPGVDSHEHVRQASWSRTADAVRAAASGQLSQFSGACQSIPPVSQPTRLYGEMTAATRSRNSLSSAVKAAGVSESMSISATTSPS